MRSRIPALLAIALCLGRVTAEAAAYKRDLFGLCTEAMAGRCAGTPGGEQAIARLVAGLEAAGQRPGNGASCRQECTVADPAPGAVLPGTVCRPTIGARRR